MHRDHEIFIQAIKNNKKILIKRRSESGRDASTKVCCPLFYVPAGDKGSCGAGVPAPRPPQQVVSQALNPRGSA